MTTLAMRKQDDASDAVLILDGVDLPPDATVTMTASTLTAWVLAYIDAAVRAGTESGIRTGLDMGLDIAPLTGKGSKPGRSVNVSRDDLGRKVMTITDRRE